MNEASNDSPSSEDQERPRSRRGRVFGLLAALGFSILMWVFIAMAVIGLLLKALR